MPGKPAISAVEAHKTGVNLLRRIIVHNGLQAFEQVRAIIGVYRRLPAGPCRVTDLAPRIGVPLQIDIIDATIWPCGEYHTRQRVHDALEVIRHTDSHCPVAIELRCAFVRGRAHHTLVSLLANILAIAP
ncbi:hypothetical protein D3C84_681650 [compost metagenome]